MLKIIFGMFYILHGLVHMIYFGQSTRLFKLHERFKWPNGSWAFSTFLKNKEIRFIAGFFCLLSALSFIAGGVALFASHATWYNLIVGSAIFSTFTFLLFWDGIFEKLDSQGIFGVLINIVIIVSLVFFHWPAIPV